MLGRHIVLGEQELCAERQYDPSLDSSNSRNNGCRTGGPSSASIIPLSLIVCGSGSQSVFRLGCVGANVPPQWWQQKPRLSRLPSFSGNNDSEQVVTFCRATELVTADSTRESPASEALCQVYDSIFLN